jgi:hypothetical protein
MNDEIKNASTGAPPKLILRRPAVGIPTDPPAPDSPGKESRPPTTKKQTTRIELSTVEAPAASGSKPQKQTSRISLEAATPAQPESSSPLSGILESAPSDEAALRTIKIKRPASSQAPKLSQPIELLLNRQSADQERISLKKQTSRISLEAALTPEEPTSAPIAEGVPTGTPATIRIKRPGKTVSEAPAAEAATPSPLPLTEQPTLTKNQTSKIEIAPSAIPATQSEGQPTQRKTIKIRRPDGSPSPTIQRSGGGGGRPHIRLGGKDAPTATPDGEANDLPPRSPLEPVLESPLTPRQKILRLAGNIVFSAVGSFAVIISGIVIYVLTLQKYDW